MRITALRPADAFQAYSLAVGVVLLATGIRLALTPLIGANYPLAVHFGAVGLAVWLAGAGPGIVCAGLGYVLVAAFVIEPKGVLPTDASAWVGLLSYALSCGIIVAIGNATRREATNAVTARTEAELHRRRAEAIIHAMADGVVVFDTHGKVTLVNEAEAQINGYGSEAAMVKDIAYFAEIYELAYPNGSPLPFHDWPVSKVMRGESLYGFEAKGRRKDTGREWYFSFSGEPIRHTDGTQILSLIVTRDITDAKKTELDLLASDERKNQFISMLSHELRNPLAPIRSAAHLLKLSTSTDQQKGKARDVIERQVEHLSRLVDNLLEVTRIKRGLFEVRPEPVDLRSIVGSQIEDYRGLIEASGLRLELDLGGGPVFVMGDKTRLAQAVANLLENAIRFNIASGDIRVSVGNFHDGAAQIVVQDTGLGICPTVLPLLFTPFGQAPQGIARTKGGLGLGLAITKSIVDMHGGSVEASSAGEHAGSSFSIRLPLTPQRPNSGREKLGLERVSKRVLVVDDNVDAAESLATLAALLGNEVRVAYDGPEAVRSAMEWCPDLILCDIGLPTMDGYEVAKRIRQEPALLSTKLIAVTGYADAEDKAKAKMAGFALHISKPADPEKITELLLAA